VSENKQPKPPEPYVIMGRILAPYGVRGWIRVQPQTEALDGLLAYRQWWLQRGDDEWSEQRLAEGRVHGSALIVRFEGIDDRDQAASFAGTRIAVPRSALPPAQQGEYYWCDLVGLTVVNLQGEVLGEVAEIFATGANDVLVVRGERERLIPFVAAAVEQVDVRTRTVLVDWASDY
jgi:16S rRNA processing protein RimM